MGNLNGADCTHDQMIATLNLHALIKENAVSSVVFDTMREAALHQCLDEVIAVFRKCYEKHKNGTAKKLGIALLHADDVATDIICKKQETANQTIVT